MAGHSADIFYRNLRIPFSIVWNCAFDVEEAELDGMKANLILGALLVAVNDKNAVGDGGDRSSEREMVQR